MSSPSVSYSDQSTHGMEIKEMAVLTGWVEEVLLAESCELEVLLDVEELPPAVPEGLLFRAT